MKGLTLTQPWASLIAAGAKRIETRSWRTDYRGWVAIHAATGFPRWCRDLIDEYPFDEELGKAGIYRLDQLPRGAVLAVARLQACVPTPPRGGTRRYTVGARAYTLPPPEPEVSFGDYAPNRFAWVFAAVRPLPAPVPWRGALGLWDVPEDTARKWLEAAGERVGERSARA